MRHPLGLPYDVEIRAFPDATRTAAQSPWALGARGNPQEAVGCELSQIVKSLVFEADGEPVLVLMDGASRVDVGLVRAELGARTVRRANADLVREATGYAIGGVPPFGHVTELRVLGRVRKAPSGPRRPGTRARCVVGRRRSTLRSPPPPCDHTHQTPRTPGPAGRTTLLCGHAPADRGLLAHEVVWAAAGTPHTVFALAPGELITHARGTLADVREQPAGVP